jgi:3D (Asp-Asp-Asp) domain-containing protein
MNKVIVFFLVANYFLNSLNATNYNIGDTLHVFTMSGLKLRESANTTSKSITTLPLGTKVIVLNTFQFEKKQTVEDISGNWILVSFNNLEGYVFDGFLSQLPVPKKREKAVYDVDDRHYFSLDVALRHYIQTEFTPIQDSIEIYNGRDGEGLGFSKIQKLNFNALKVYESGWEWSGTKLIFDNIRLAEVKNLVFLLAENIELKPKDFEKLRQGIKIDSKGLNGNGNFHFVEGDFVIDIYHYPKQKNKWAISISLVHA